MKSIKPNTPNCSPIRYDSPAADVWWGEHGIDALIWPKPYVFWLPEEAVQPDMAAASKEAV
jgi:hypothetical protein